MSKRSSLYLVLIFLLTAAIVSGQKTSDGISYVVLKEGSGASPRMGQEVKCHYLVKDINGNVLWSTRSMNMPEHIVLGEKNSQMAKVRDNCFLIMNTGSRYNFKFPKALMSNAAQAATIPGTHVSYDIELLSVGAPRPSAVKLFKQTQNQQGVQAAVAKLQSLSRSGSGGYAMREADLNRLGYELLQSRETEAAIAVFQVNVNLYPRSFNAYDSLGDAYVAKGDKVQAKSSFEKALQLNPSFEAARQKLRNL